MSKIPYSHYNKNSAFEGKTWNRITSFFVKKGTSEEHAVTVKHGVIYNSFDCNTKLSHHIFSNSKVQSKLSCRRTKVRS
jgi:hypothetical protein